MQASQTTCCTSGCGSPAVAQLDVRALCRTHFIGACYGHIDEYTRWLDENRMRETNTEQVRRFLSECTRQATELSQSIKDLDNLERARLLDILLRASELGKHLRRSPRKEAAIPVHLSSDILGRSWDDRAQTDVISRYGASLECSPHAVEVGDVLTVTRLDTGAHVRARVIWCQPRPGGKLELGLELQQSDNFWNIDWNSAEPAVWSSNVPPNPPR